MAESTEEVTEEVVSEPQDTDFVTEVTSEAPVDTELDAKEHIELIDDQNVVVADSTDGFRDKIQALIDTIPQCVTNEDIKKASNQFIEDAHTWLTQTDQSFPNTSKQIQGLLGLVRGSVEIGKSVSQS